MNTLGASSNHRVGLRLSPADAERLRRLQEAFSRGCNFLSPIARAHRCWSRVALHHLGYKALRETHPELGAQMTCNAIYAVCRACLAIYMNPAQPWGPKIRQTDALPEIVFSTQAPVYFDKHTLSIREHQASIFTLEGRLHCELAIETTLSQRLRSERLVQTLLMSVGPGFVLDFQFESEAMTRARNRPRDLAPSEAALAAHLQVDRASPPGQPDRGPQAPQPTQRRPFSAS